MLNGFLKPKARISFQKLLGWYFRIGIHFSPLLIKWKVLKKLTKNLFYKGETAAEEAGAAGAAEAG